jgi:PIN domain nuclease of toxin-antitoxin system
MSLLLDTHVVLWWLSDDASLDDDIKTRLDHEPDIYVSAASLWEVGIKQAIGKLTDPANLLEHIRDSAFRPLPMTFEHAIAASRLPLIHRDPFDRMLIAQAVCEDLTLVTRDPEVQKYQVAFLPV